MILILFADILSDTAKY